MKKLVALISVLALTAPVFAQDSVLVLARKSGRPTTQLDEHALKRALIAAQAEKLSAATVELIRAADINPSELSDLQKQTVKEFDSFAKAAYTVEYYDANMLFQLMDGLRVSYMKLHENEVENARTLAKGIHSTAIQIANGQRTITVGEYINMEVVSLYPSEQEKFEAFRTALEEDMQ